MIDPLYYFPYLEFNFDAVVWKWMIRILQISLNNVWPWFWSQSYYTIFVLYKKLRLISLNVYVTSKENITNSTILSYIKVYQKNLMKFSRLRQKMYRIGSCKKQSYKELSCSKCFHSKLVAELRRKRKKTLFSMY